MIDFETWSSVKNPPITTATGAPSIIIAKNIKSLGVTTAITLAVGRPYTVYSYGSVTPFGIIVSVEWSADPIGEVWTIQTVGGPPVSFHAGEFLDPLFIVVGSGGNIFTSLTGEVWQAQTSNTVEALRGAFIGEDDFAVATAVALGDNGALVSSMDGTTWAVQNSNTAQTLHGGVFANGLAVVCGSSGTIVTSFNLAAWTVQSTPVSQVLFSIAFGVGLYVAVGNGSIITSPDGIVWTERQSPISTGLIDIIFAGEQFLAISSVSDAPNIMVSSDGIFWKLAGIGIPDSSLLTAAFIFNTYLVAGENGELFTSANVSDWVQQDSRTSEDIRTIFEGDDILIFAGLASVINTNTIHWEALRDVNDVPVAFEGVFTFNIPRIGANISLRTRTTVVSDTTTNVTIDLR